jgi:alkyl hydroperoxide reductase subunit AhpC
MNAARRSFSGRTAESSAATTPSRAAGDSVLVMRISTSSAAPDVVADAFVSGEGRRRVALADFRGTWVVLAFGARRFDAVELGELEEAFAADGAVVLAATPHDWHDTAERYAGTPVRFPVLAGVAEHRRITMIVDPGGVVRHVGLRRSARETLATLEALIAPPRLLEAA